MNKTMRDILNDFFSGACEGISGSKSNPGNLKICGDQVIHFNTPILERYNNKYLLNMTRYSIQTGRLQKLIMEILNEEQYDIVLKVPMDSKESLNKYIKE